MSLRTRLVLSLAVTFAVALLVAGLALVGLVRQSMVGAARPGARLARGDERSRRPPPGPLGLGRGRAARRRHAARPRGPHHALVPVGLRQRPRSPPRPAGLRRRHPVARVRHASTTARRRTARSSTATLLGQGRRWRRDRDRRADDRRRGRHAGADPDAAARRRRSRCSCSWSTAFVIVRRGLLPLERIARHRAGDRGRRPVAPGRRPPRRHGGGPAGHGLRHDARPDRVELQRPAGGARREGRAARTGCGSSSSDASHELRTPLTAVRGYADLYRAGGLADPADLERAMDRIGTESRRMALLVDDLLLLARLDQGRPLARGPRRPEPARPRRRRPMPGPSSRRGRSAAAWPTGSP